MTRLKPAGPGKYEPIFGKDADVYLRVLSHRPASAEAWDQFTKAMYEDRSLPPRLYELVRLRVAFWNQCRTCMALRYEDATADGMTEDLVCSLEKPQEAKDLTNAERAAIAFADRMATDHHSITDQTYEGLREHFDEAEIVDLCLQLAYFIGFGRMAASWDMVEELPERYRDEGRVTPWGAGEEVVPKQRRADAADGAIS